MADPRLLSRCGIYCGACYVYRAERDGGALLDELLRRLGISREKIKCRGCSGPCEEQWPNCKDCAYKQCQGNNGVENCAQCGNFDECIEYRRIEALTVKRGEDVRGSLMKIRAGGGEAWLKEQEARWSCPHCGQPLSWYDNTCRACGRRLREKPVTLDD